MSMWTEAVAAKERSEMISVDLSRGFEVVAGVFEDSTENAFRHITHELGGQTDVNLKLR